MNERDLFNAVRHGQGSKGFHYPAMSYTAYAKLTDQDMHDFWTYVSIVKSVSNAVDENGGMLLPFIIRLVMAGWDMLFYDRKPLPATPGKSPEWENGRYLVDGGGHCSACHAPCNPLGTVSSGNFLQGARIGFWYGPDLTGNDHVGLGQATAEEIVRYLKTGSAKTAVAAFLGDQGLESDDAASAITVMVVGGRAASTHSKPTGAGMPSLAS